MFFLTKSRSAFAFYIYTLEIIQRPSETVSVSDKKTLIFIKRFSRLFTFHLNRL